MSAQEPQRVLIQSARTFLAKSDGKDKLLATLQYISMFISGGSPGSVKKVQTSITAARKVFRICKPLESLAPLVLSPSLDWRKPMHIEILKKLKCIMMAIYFGGDHVVWMKQAGLIESAEIFQKVSMYGWFGGSMCTILTEIYELQAMLKRKYGETDAEYDIRQKKMQNEVKEKSIVLIHAMFQALLAMGLLGLLAPEGKRRWRPRTVGLFGIASSAINCYMMYPPVLSSLLPSSPPDKKKA